MGLGPRGVFVNKEQMTWRETVLDAGGIILVVLVLWLVLQAAPAVDSLLAWK